MTRLGSYVVLLSLAVAPLALAGEAGWIADVKTGCKIWNLYPQPNESMQWSGDCREGLAEGRGTVQWLANGQPTGTCECEYHEGKRNGRGIEKYARGSGYDGDFLDDKRDGQGTMTFPSGSTYVGEWRHGVPDGYGVYTPLKRPVLKGRWVDGCLRTDEVEVRLFYTKGGCGQV